MPPDHYYRIYYVSDERLKAFKALLTLEKLRWQEQVSMFLRMARLQQPLLPAPRSEIVTSETITPPSA
jgi:hypothetical protein